MTTKYLYGKMTWPGDQRSGGAEASSSAAHGMHRGPRPALAAWTWTCFCPLPFANARPSLSRTNALWCQRLPTATIRTTWTSPA